MFNIFNITTTHEPPINPHQIGIDSISRLHRLQRLIWVCARFGLEGSERYGGQSWQGGALCIVGIQGCCFLVLSISFHVDSFFDPFLAVLICPGSWLHMKTQIFLNGLHFGQPS